jgi:hypothetical protein
MKPVVGGVPELCQAKANSAGWPPQLLVAERWTVEFGGAGDAGLTVPTVPLQSALVTLPTDSTLASVEPQPTVPSTSQPVATTNRFNPPMTHLPTRRG